MGTLPYFIKSLSLSPFTSTFYRLSTGLLFTSTFMLVLRIKPEFNRKLLLLALTNTGFIFLYISAITYLSAATAALLLYMAPVYVTAYTIVHERVEKKSILSLILGLIGLYLLLLPEKVSVGVISGFISGFLYAIAFILMNRLGKIHNPVQITFSNLLIGSIIMLPFFDLRFERPELILGLGLVPTAIPFAILCYGMSRIKVEKGSIIALVEPLTAGLIGYLFFSELLMGVQFVGGVLILAAVFLAVVE